MGDVNWEKEEICQMAQEEDEFAMLVNGLHMLGR